MVQAALPVAALACLSSLILGGIGLGGGIYETLLIDRVWPDNPAIVQPGRGGINRKLFWGPIHVLYELALLSSTWLVWSDGKVRRWILAALVIHLAARAWSFAYFIPNALRFERIGHLTGEQRRLADRWTRLGRYRPVLNAASLLALLAGILSLRPA